ncbi:hypothetical protein G6F65_022275 [Rhizopus arrhizus]|nr:hypothetical protein G6F65_022275 [Rhizopus arrhizus]
MQAQALFTQEIRKPVQARHGVAVWVEAGMLLDFLAIDCQREAHAGGGGIRRYDARAQHDALIEHVVCQQFRQARVFGRRIAATQDFQRKPGAADCGIDFRFGAVFDA